MDALLQVDGLAKTYGGDTVLKDVSFSVSQGETLVVLGPSGSGKSTLLRCIAQLVPVDEGRMRLGEERLGYTSLSPDAKPLRAGAVAGQRRETGMVFQNFNLFGHLSALENITLAPRRVSGVADEDAVKLARSLLDRVGLAHRAHAYPRELSGGQQQRVAIARALAMSPKILLFDEPTSALDPEMIQDVLALMVELAEDGMTMIVVTHETSFAKKVARHVMFMEAGRVLEIAPTREFFENPSSERSREFLSKIL